MDELKVALRVKIFVYVKTFNGALCPATVHCTYRLTDR